MKYFVILIISVMVASCSIHVNNAKVKNNGLIHDKETHESGNITQGSEMKGAQNDNDR